MIKTILFLPLLLWTHIAFSQTEEVSEVAAESTPPNNFDLGKITKRKNKYGIVTADGVERVPTKYDSLVEVTRDVIIAYKKKKSGIITRSNKIVVPFIYDSITKFDELYNHLKTSIDNKKGVITYEGKVVVGATYTDVIWNKIGNFFLVKMDKRIGVVSQTGDMLLKPVVADYIPDKVLEGSTAKYFYFLVGNQWGLMNTDGTIAIPANYAHLHYMKDHKLFLGQSLHNRNTFTILDEKNHVIVPSQKIQYMVSPDFIIVKDNGQYGAIDISNKQVVPYGKYDELVCTQTGDCPSLIYVKINGKQGMMDEKGNLLTEVKYDYLDYNKKGCFIEYKINQRSGLLDQFGKTILEHNFVGFFIWTDTKRILASDESGVRLYNFQGKQLTTHIFERIENNGSKKFFSFIEKGKYGLINTEGEIIIKPEYDKIFEKRYYESDIFGQKNGRRVFLVTE